MKALSEYHKHKGRKDGLCDLCKECNRAHVKKHRDENQSWLKDANKKNYAKNKVAMNERAKKWREENRERYLKLCKDYYKKNRVEQLAIQSARYYADKTRKREYDKTRRAKMPWIENAASAKKRASKKQRTPSWANLSAIKEIYKYAKSIDGHVVDHIVPLNGKEVCGLHVEYNLRVISATENSKKSNKLIDVNATSVIESIEFYKYRKAA